MIWRGFIIAALLAVAGLILLARREHPEDLLKMTATPPPPQPGYFMTEARVVQTGPDGLPLYRMNAARIQQNPEDLTIRLESLHLDYFPKPGEGAAATTQPSHWILTAKSGLMPQDATHIELLEDVQIKGQPRLGGQIGAAAEATIRTSKLSVNVQTQIASTRERVDIVWGDRQLSATGLMADLKAQRVKLESDVHGRFTR